VRIVTREPHPALRPFVQSLWYFEGPDLPHAREKVLPDGAMQLLVNLEEDELRWWQGDALDEPRTTAGAAVSGTFERAIVIDTREQRRITGVSFVPGGAPPLLGLPSDEASEAHPALEDVWGRDRYARERLLEAPTAEAVLATWDALLLHALRGSVDPRLAFAIEALDRGDAVRAVAGELGWSGRRLRQRFVAQVGLFPKRFARVRRLQHILQSIARGRFGSFAQLAAAHGFTDQAHLIRDFRDLTLTTPTRYRARDDDGVNHVVLD